MSEKRQDSRRTVGLVVNRLEERVDWWVGASEAARDRDVNLLTFPGGLTWEPGMRTILNELVGVENVDGLVTAQWWPNAAAFEEAYAQFYHPLPVVNIQRLYEGRHGVITDNYRGVYALMQHLIEVHGYRRMAFFGGPESNPSAVGRYQAYLDTMRAYDLPVDLKMVTTGEFNETSGAEGVRVLLDEHKLRPQEDFEVIVTASDQIALGAFAALQSRGILVPEDVALVGFDDIEEAELLVPPLTTVRMPNYEMGKMATEMLLDHLAGEKVEMHVTIPAQVIVRETCGCVAQTALGVVAGEGVSPDSQDEFAAVAARREQILAALCLALGDFSRRIGDAWAGALVDTFVAAVESDVSPRFLGTFRDIVQRLHVAGVPDHLWHSLLSVLRRQLLPFLGGDAIRLRRAENLWQQARVLLADVVERLNAREQQAKVQSVERLHEVGPALLTTFVVAEQMDILVEHLKALDISSCYIALYADATAPLDGARLILAFDEHDRVALPPEGLAFPTRHLAPDGVLPRDKAYNLTVEPLYFQDRQLGFALFGVGSVQPREYEILGRQISTALQGALTSQAQAQAEQTLRRQAVQRQTAAEVSQVASSILEPDELIRQVVDVIRERFDLYYTGLFLVDEGDSIAADTGSRWAVLQAGTGDAGRVMVEAGHKLEVGGSSMIGWCVANKRARIALDVGAEAARFDNPYLPETRSELALPLVSRGDAIGALTIQSTREAAFTEEDITVLQTMADQLANAIQNVRLLERSQATLREMEAVQRRYGQRAWTEYVQAMTAPQYEVQRSGDAPLGDALLPEIRQAITQTAARALPVDEDAAQPHSALVAPITRRGGVVIGALGIHDDADRKWTEDEIALVEAVVERMSLTAENLRLLDETQQRAARERTVAEVGARIRESLEMETLLRTAASEMRQALGLEDMIVRLAAADEDGAV